MKSNRRYELKYCSGCSIECDKRADTLKTWSGFCRTCSNKKVANNPEIKLRRIESFKKIVIAKERKCIDCNKDIASLYAKRCNNCYRKLNVGENNPNYKHGLSKTREYSNHHCSIRRVREISNNQNIESHTIKEWEYLKKKYNNMCLCCKCFEPEIKLTRDHIIPVLHGGSNAINNIQPLCFSCNARKHTKDTDYRNTIEVSRSIN